MQILEAIIRWTRDMRLPGFVCMCIGVSPIPAEQLLADERGGRSKLQVQVVGQVVSAEMGDVGLGEVLRQIAEQAGFAAEISGDLGQVQPQAFEGVPLDEAIRRLIGDNRLNLVMRYEVGKDGKRRLAEVRAQAATEVPPEMLEQERLRLSLRRIQPPPPPPPPPFGLSQN